MHLLLIVLCAISYRFEDGSTTFLEGIIDRFLDSRAIHLLSIHLTSG